MGIKDSIEMWWSCGGVEDSISLLESKTPLKYGTVKDSIKMW